MRAAVVNIRSNSWTSSRCRDMSSSTENIMQNFQHQINKRKCWACKRDEVQLVTTFFMVTKCPNLWRVLPQAGELNDSLWLVWSHLTKAKKNMSRVLQDTILHSSRASAIRPRRPTQLPAKKPMPRGLETWYQPSRENAPVQVTSQLLHNEIRALVMKGGPRDSGKLPLSQSQLLSPPWRIYRLGQLTLAFSVCPPRRSLKASLHLGFSQQQLPYESKARCTRPISYQNVSLSL